MRVISGSARSLPLTAPTGSDTRPTTDRIKETLFNILQPSIPGSVFVDLFSGSGAIGIEALSRGAQKAYFVENAPKALDCIRKNLDFTGFTENSVVLKQDVCAGLTNIFEKEADIIFMDPPYKEGQEKRALEVLREMKYVTEDTLIIIESDLKETFDYLPELGFRLIREKNYKTNKHVFIKRSED